MPVRRALWLIGTAAAASWLLQPAVAQDEEAIPDELRIIEDLPEIAAERDTLEDDAVADGERPADEPVMLEGGPGTLFDDDYSLLFAPPEEMPAERLPPDEDDRPAIDLDPRSRGGERDRDLLPDNLDRDDPLRRDEALQDRVTGPEASDPDLQDPVTEPDDPVAAPEPSGPRTDSEADRPAGGTSGGGSGSLF